MRILHAAPFGNPSPGGFIPLIEALAERLRARGDDFAFVVPRVAGATWHDRVRSAGAELHVVDERADAVRFARAWRPDVTHAHFFGWEPALTVGLWTSRSRLFWHAHSTTLANGRALRAARAFAKYRVLGARVERFVAVTRAIAAEIVALGASSARTTVVPNEIDAVHFRPPSAAERADARARYGLDGPTLLFYGRDPHLKGADVLREALARAPGFTVIAVGTPAAVRTELAPFARIIEVERLDDVRPLLWAADALALPSRGEGMSFAHREAVTSGLPAVASDLPALREAGDGITHFFPVGDASAMAVALHEAVRATRAAAEPPGERGGVDRWVDRILDLYKKSGGTAGTRVSSCG